MFFFLGEESLRRLVTRAFIHVRDIKFNGFLLNYHQTIVLTAFVKRVVKADKGYDISDLELKCIVQDLCTYVRR